MPDSDTGQALPLYRPGPPFCWRPGGGGPRFAAGRNFVTEKTLWVMSDESWVLADGRRLRGIVVEILVPFFVFFALGSVGIAFSPIGKARARRLGGGKDEQAEGAALAEVDALREEMQQLRGELGDVQERLDFAERLLAQARMQGKLPAGGQ